MTSKTRVAKWFEGEDARVGGWQRKTDTVRGCYRKRNKDTESGNERERMGVTTRGGERERVCVCRREESKK